MSELTKQQYEQLRTRVNSLPWDTLKGFLTWTYEGRELNAGDFPDATGTRKQQIEDYFANPTPTPNPGEQAEWADIQSHLHATTLSSMQLLRAKLEAYISRWSVRPPMGNHLQEANDMLVNTIIPGIHGWRQKEEEKDWSEVDHFRVKSLLDFYRKYPETSHKDEIDDEVFGLQKSSRPLEALIAAIQQYKGAFPAGRHVAEADKILDAAILWNQVRMGDIYAVSDYCRDYPESPFKNDAFTRLMELKNEAVERMKKNYDSEMMRDELLTLLNRHIFTEQELIYNELCTDETLEIIKNWLDVKDSLPKFDDIVTSCRPECFSNHTDVFLFGIPATGKSCLLAGLLETGVLNYDSVVAGGPYADAVVQWMDNCFPPVPTRKNYLTTIKAWLRTENKTHLFDLVEMAGEEFADKIAHNPDGEVYFEDMGTGAAKLLSNDNRKIFFIVVDPTADTVKFFRQEEQTDAEGNIFYTTKSVIVNQKHTLKRMIDLFNQPGNADIMKKVDAIHFIVTKADFLGDDHDARTEKARTLLQSRYSVSIDTLKSICKRFGINRATNEIPYVFPFSLGRFYVGNIVKYDETDSLSLLEIMKGNVKPVKDENFWDKLKKFMAG